MPADISHFSMVGFDFPTQSAAASGPWARKFLETCKVVTLDPNDLVCVVSDTSGGELRIALRKTGQTASIITMNPGFVGEGRTKVDIVAPNSDPDYAPFEVGVAARFAGEQTPLVVDLADPSQAAAAKPGQTVTFDIAAFSFQPDIFPDEAAFYAAQGKAKVRLAAGFFIPSGMVFEKVGGAMPDAAKRPVAYADFAGKVLKVGQRANAAAGGRFWWMLVQTYGGATIDVVMDPATVKAEPKVGSIVTGRFWLSARVVQP